MPPRKSAKPGAKRRFGGPQFAREGKLRLVRRQDLDQRTLAAKMFDAQVAQIKADLGTTDLSAIECQLIENFAGISVMINDMTVQLLLGKPVDPFAFCQLSSTSVRVASRLGLHRRSRDVTPVDPLAYARSQGDEQPDDGGER
jgi:hypothetical protein